ncbi:MAG: hypothetical protein H6737_29375 [Alphaproteobacteria bacterium]|nr:hypothetical protein [Alphaproteobacteria bacterium]
MSFFDRLFRRSPTQPEDPYEAAISETCQMVWSPVAQGLAARHGLNVTSVTWEDTGRFQGSCVGPNISDMTIQVEHDGKVRCMPVIRYPNFTDHTADIPLADVGLLVGNESGRALRRVSLADYLSDLRAHLSDASSWAGDGRSLLRPDEREVLVSAQACFLPVPAKGEARFNPVLFNYQSYPGCPAVLAILATREGTSATIIDNQRDAFAEGAVWGQRLFHNKAGQRASFTGSRLSDFVERGGDGTDAPQTLEEARDAGLNQVLLIQIPLKQPERAFAFEDCFEAAGAAPCAPRSSGIAGLFRPSDVEEAVIGHGAVEGPFTEIDGLPIERDPRFPIRVTVQLYKATSNGVVNAADLAEIAEAIRAIYADAKASGSLVMGSTGRSTEWDDEGRGKAEPPDWWARFWAKREAVTGKTRAQLVAELERLLGRAIPEDELRKVVRSELFGD